jgi:hypothetical protein
LAKLKAMQASCRVASFSARFLAERLVPTAALRSPSRSSDVPRRR